MKAAEIISDDAANSLLATVGMTLGSWHEINLMHGKRENISTVSSKAPDNALELLCFAQHVVAWLPNGDWKILVTDNSNSPTKDEDILLHRGLLSSPQKGAFNALFRFNVDSEDAFETNIALAHAVFLLLMFEGHAYLTSSNSTELQILGIQDGYAHLYAGDLKISEAEKILDGFNQNPLATPKWITEGL